MAITDFDFNFSSRSSQTKIQNSLPNTAPAFCNTPFFYVNGLEKSVKIGTKSFNYIDYLEAWRGRDCYTNRSEDALTRIRSKIKRAFQETETPKVSQK